MTPYENLANAIIIQAVKDYRTALKTLKRNPDNMDAADTVNEVERFFPLPVVYGFIGRIWRISHSKIKAGGVWLMTAKEYLRQAYRLDQKINSKLRQINSLRALSQKVTASYDGDVVSHTRNVTGLEDSVIRLIESEDELNQQIKELVDLRREIARVIDAVGNDTYQMILEMRYLCYMSWNEIAENMNYSRRWVLQMHARAVEKVNEVLKEVNA